MIYSIHSKKLDTCKSGYTCIVECQICPILTKNVLLSTGTLELVRLTLCQLLGMNSSQLETYHVNKLDGFFDGPHIPNQGSKNLPKTEDLVLENCM